MKGANSEVRSINAEAPLLEQMLAAGIRAEDAPQVFAHALAADRRQVIVSSIPLSRLRAAHVTRSTASADAPKGDVPQVAYADAIEAKIAHMCIDILGLDTIRPQDEFLSFGGGSLAGVRLFARIRKEFGIDLSLSALFKAPTVQALADLVREHSGASDPKAGEAAKGGSDSKTAAAAWTPLVRIAAGSAHRRPLFCVHGAGGNVITFKALADRLARDLPIFALEARGIDGRAPFHTSIEEAAECNIEAICAAHPKGPYRLAGFSGGGVIAYEMARRLTRMGKSIELLVMFDTLAPGEIRMPLSLWDRIKLLRRSSLGFTLDWPRRKITFLMEARRIRLAETGRVPEAASRLEIIGAKSFDAYVAMQSRYETKPYDGDVLLFRARHAAMPYVRAGRALGWDKFVGGRLEEIAVDAWHSTMFAPPAVDVLAAVLDARLDALDIPERSDVVGAEAPAGTKQPA
jgi:thioesterase domain-containing protein/acyl carrier protein